MDAILSFPFQIIQRGKVVMGVFKSLFISFPIHSVYTGSTIYGISNCGSQCELGRRDLFTGFPIVAGNEELWIPGGAGLNGGSIRDIGQIGRIDGEYEAR